MEMKNIFTNSEHDDFIVWEPSISGTHTTKSEYYWLTLLSGPNPNAVMTWTLEA